MKLFHRRLKTDKWNGQYSSENESVVKKVSEKDMKKKKRLL